MTRTEMKQKAEAYRELAEQAEGGMRLVYLKKARDYYAEAGYTGLAAWCERHMG